MPAGTSTTNISLLPLCHAVNAIRVPPGAAAFYYSKEVTQSLGDNTVDGRAKIEELHKRMK
jgi:hypothetical protein